MSEGIFSPGRVAAMMLRVRSYRGIAEASEIGALLVSHERLRAMVMGSDAGPVPMMVEVPVVFSPREVVMQPHAALRTVHCGICNQSGHNRKTCGRRR